MASNLENQTLLTTDVQIEQGPEMIQQTSTGQSPFADEAFIPIPGLTVLRAHAQIVQTIQKAKGHHFDLFDPQESRFFSTLQM